MMISNTSKTSERPLLGAQFCCTSIAPETRTELAAWAEEMGADHSLDLTSDVTHLLVGSSDSEKYRYVAREREDVKVLLPEFVGAVRELWMNDQPIDLNALEAQYRCPTLFSLKLCITGFDDIAFRNELAKNIVQNGGVYDGDLTRDVTHLVAHAPSGKKYEYATAWGLKIVSIKWYKDTRDRGMQLDESKYHPALSPEDQGVGAWVRKTHDSPVLGKRTRPDQPEEKMTRKLRRTASARFGSQQSEMWGDIVGGRAEGSAETADARLRPTKSMSNVMGQLNATTEISGGSARLHESSRPVPQPLPSGILTNKHFATKGFDERKRHILTQHLVGNDGLLHSRLSELQHEAQANAESCFLVVPHDIGNSQLAILEQNRSNVTLVTELWLEHCISNKIFIPPHEYVLGQPASAINVPAISKLVVNASGFPQLQTLHISKIVKKLGARYEETFTPETSVLLCNSANINQQKCEYAQEWMIPIVSEKWLWQLIKSARIPLFESFLLFGGSTAPTKRKVPEAEVQRPSSGPSERPQLDLAQVDRALLARPESAKRSNRNALSDGFGDDVVGGKGKEDSKGSNQSVSSTKLHRNKVPTPLQEVSANIMSKQASPTKAKKKLFQSYDGNGSNHDDDYVTVDIPPDNDESFEIIAKDDVKPEQDAQAVSNEPMDKQAQERKQSDVIKELLDMKAVAAEAAKRPDSQNKTKKLFGRASSNLSNSSRRSNDIPDQVDRNRRPLSRASSINSVNTDGLGMPLSMMSRIPSEIQNKPAKAASNAPMSRINNIRNHVADESFVTAADDSSQGPGMNPSDFHAALISMSTSQVPQPPSPSQVAHLTYAASKDATALKAELANKRRNRARTGQKEGDSDPMLSREESEEKRQREWRERQAKEKVGLLNRDDEAVVGVGRRTRGREKALSRMLHDEDDNGWMNIL